jgi:large-conductance mechanosensitive channel
MITILAIWAFIAVAIAIFATVYLVLRIRNAHSEAALSGKEHAHEEEEAYRLAKARLIYRRERKLKKDDAPTSIFGTEVPTHLRMD